MTYGLRNSSLEELLEQASIAAKSCRTNKLLSKLVVASERHVSKAKRLTQFVSMNFEALKSGPSLKLAKADVRDSMSASTYFSKVTHSAKGGHQHLITPAGEQSFNEIFKVYKAKTGNKAQVTCVQVSVYDARIANANDLPAILQKY